MVFKLYDTVLKFDRKEFKPSLQTKESIQISFLLRILRTMQIIRNFNKNRIVYFLLETRGQKYVYQQFQSSTRSLNFNFKPIERLRQILDFYSPLPSAAGDVFSRMILSTKARDLGTIRTFLLINLTCYDLIKRVCSIKSLTLQLLISKEDSIILMK